AVTKPAHAGSTNAPDSTANTPWSTSQWRLPYYPTREHARNDIARYIETRYNSRRRHSRLGYKTPRQVRYEFQDLQLAV
ncbi:IS3 family transposase, partial [Micromonospora chalcea]